MFQSRSVQFFVLLGALCLLSASAQCASLQRSKTPKECNEELRVRRLELKTAGISVREFLLTCWTTQYDEPTPANVTRQTQPLALKSDRERHLPFKSALTCNEELRARSADLKTAGVSIREFLMACWLTAPGTPTPIMTADSKPDHLKRPPVAQIDHKSEKQAKVNKVKLFAPQMNVFNPLKRYVQQRMRLPSIASVSRSKFRTARVPSIRQHMPRLESFHKSTKNGKRVYWVFPLLSTQFGSIFAVGDQESLAAADLSYLCSKNTFSILWEGRSPLCMNLQTAELEDVPVKLRRKRRLRHSGL